MVSSAVTICRLGTSWRFFDRTEDHGLVDRAWIESQGWLAQAEHWTCSSSRALIFTAALSLAFIAWSAQALRVEAELPEAIDLPIVAGWERVDYAPASWWEPRASGADHRLLGSYRDEAGQQVDVFLALYAAQAEGREASAYGEGALVPDSAWRWHSYGPRFAGGTSERLQATRDVQRLTLTLYRHRDWLGSSVARLKLSNLADRLAFDPHPTTMLILSAEERAGQDAEQAIRAFMQSTAPLGEWLDRLGQKP